MLDTSIIGWQMPPKSIVVEAGQLKAFAKATGTKNRIYWDLEAARAVGHPSLPAPPTFLFSLDMLAPDKGPGITQKLKIDIARILHGEQRFMYAKPIYAGDEITLTTKVVDAYEKKGGALQFILTETAGINQRGESVGSMTRSIVVRN